MARGRFEGITLLVDGDTVGLDKALGQINSKVRGTESELSKVERLLKFNPKNTELLAQKQQILTDRVEGTRNKLDQLKDAEQQVQDKFAAGDIKEAQYRAFQRELTETESKLKHFEKELILSQSKLNSYGESMQKAGDKMKNVGKGMTDTGNKLSMTVTAPIVGIGAAATNSAIKFESAFAGVRKTVDATDEEFATLEKGIRDMALEIPASAEEIASVAEAAGQLGIENKNILGFTRTIIELGEATNMTTEQAASELARFANITGMSQTKFNNFGSSLVALGNNFATTESEIMSMSMRLAGAGSQIGLSETDIAALATTMSSLGVEAEAGGTAMSMVMKKMQNAVTNGGAELENFASAAHMSTSEFADAFNNDPMSAMIGLVQGLEESAASGENLNGVLESLGVKGIRESDALLRMAGNSELLADAVDLSSSAFEENTALSDEAAERYKTTESQLALLKNTLTEIGIMIGEVIIPVLLDMLESIRPVLDYIRNMDKDTLKLIVTIGAIAAAIGPLLVVLGLMAQGLGSIFTVVGTVMSGMAKMGAAFKVAGGAVTLLSNPIGLAVAAIGLLAGAFVLAYTKSETFRNFINGIGEMITGAISWIGNFTKAILGIWSGNDDNNGPAELLMSLGLSDENVQKIYGLTDTVKGLVTSIFDSFKNSVDWMKNFLTSAWAGIQNIFNTAVTGIKNIFMGYVDSMKAGADQMMSGIGNIFGGFYDLLKNLLLGPVLLITQGITGDWSGLLSSAKQLWGNIFDSISDILNGLVDAVSGFGSSVSGMFSETWHNITTGTKAAWDLIWGSITDAISWIGDTITNGFNGFVSSVVNSGDSLWREITGLWDRILGFFTNISLKDAGTDLMLGFIDGIIIKAVSINDTIRNIAEGTIKTIKRILGIKSPSRVFKEIGVFTGEGLENGLISMGNRVRNASQKMADDAVVQPPPLDMQALNDATAVLKQYSAELNNVKALSQAAMASMAQQNQLMAQANAYANNLQTSGGGNITFTGDMNIRNEQDITKLARQLALEIQRNARGRG